MMNVFLCDKYLVQILIFNCTSEVLENDYEK